MEVDLHEVLTGAVSSTGHPLGARPLALDLDLRGNGLREVALGAPFAVSGTFAAADTGAPGERGGPTILPPAGVVWGTARLLVPRGIFYDLRLAARPDAEPRDVAILEGARRFVRGDLYASATMLEGQLRQGPQTLDVRLRFDARDDLASLVRSVRLQPWSSRRSAILSRGRGGP